MPVLTKTSSVLGLRIDGDQLEPQFVKIDASFEKCPIAHAAGIPLFVKALKLPGVRLGSGRCYIICRMMSEPSMGISPVRWQFGGALPPAPPVILGRSDGIPFTLKDWMVLDEFEMEMLDDGPRHVTRRDFVEFARSCYDYHDSHLVLEALLPKGTCVRAKGLIHSAHLNGKNGVTTGKFENGRVGVKFEGNDVAVKWENLET